MFLIFLILISQLALTKCLPANGGVFSNCLHVFHPVCRPSLPFVSQMMSWVAFVTHPSVFGCTGRSYRSKPDLQTTAFLRATEGEQRSTVELPQSCQEELISLFSLSPWGFVVDVRTCMKKSQPDMFIFHLWRRASSRAPNNTQSAFFFPAFLSRGQRKGDTNEMRKNAA